MQQDGKEKEMADLSPKLHRPLNRSFFCKRQENINLVKIMTKHARKALSHLSHLSILPSSSLLLNIILLKV